MTHLHDTEVLKFIADTNAALSQRATAATPDEMRMSYDAMCKKFWVAHPESIKTQDFEMDGIPVRVYTPENAGKRAILFTHGGGFVLGSLDSHDDVCAELAAATGTEVWASHYRLSPEHIYPAALDDVEAVWRRLTLDRREAVVVGDSAGARLSAALCLRMRRLDGPMPIAQILIYPTLGGSATLPSFIENANAPMLTAADMNNFDVLYKGDYQDGKDPELSPLQAQEFSGLPPAYVVTADIDPLRDEGSTYVDKLRKAGVKAQWKNEPQLVHGYLRARHSSQRAHDSFSGIVEKLQTFLV